MKRKTIAGGLLLALLLFAAGPVFAADKETLDRAVREGAAYVLDSVKEPAVSSVGGEWAVIGLARSGYPVPDAYYQAYFRAAEKKVRDGKGVLHERKYSEYSRVILALSAAGYDPRDIGGYDLTAPLGDYEKTVWQGINGPVWALIALDSLDYAIPVNGEAKTQATRDMYVGEILRRQTADGGWNLGGEESGSRGQGKGDADLTGMALQALAKYRGEAEVQAAVERALGFLSVTQDERGGYSTSYSAGSSAVESAVQAAAALSALGITIEDARFVKNGYSLADNILLHKNAKGGYSHSLEGDGANDLMASEQALYGLVAVKRAMEEKNSLYQMRDGEKRAQFKPISGAGLPGKHADVKGAEIRTPGKRFLDTAGHAYREGISALAERGIIGGRSEAVFDPDAPLTRAEFAAIVTRALGLPVKRVSAFTDVAASAWYAGAAETAYYYEIAGGTSPGVFYPEGTISRQEAAVMTARAARLAGMDTAMSETSARNVLAQFDDYRTAGEWAWPELAFCYAEGILDDEALAIRPLEAIKRGETADMLFRMLTKANLL